MTPHDYRHLLATLNAETDAVRAIRVVADQHTIGDSWRGPVRYRAEIAKDSVVDRITRAESALQDAAVAAAVLWRESLTSESFLG